MIEPPNDGPSETEGPLDPRTATGDVAGVAADSASAEAADSVAPPEPLSPFAKLSTRARAVVGGAFDVLTRSGAEMRRASFYVGVLVAATVAPFVLLTWRVLVEVQSMTRLQIRDLGDSGLGGYSNLAFLVALAGVVVAYVDSRAIAIQVLAARLAGRRLEVKVALERARRVFWRVVRATILVTVPLTILQVLFQVWLLRVFGADEVAGLASALLTTVVGAPFVYVLACIVLGDVGAIAAVRRSTQLFRTHKLAAVVVALFAWSAQLLTTFGLGAGLGIVLRVTDFTGLSSSTDPMGTAITVGLLVAFVFALGTLVFTVGAISLAPQVVMYLAIAQAAPGLDAGPLPQASGERRFRWLTRPYVALAVTGLLALLAGLRALAG